MRRCNQCVVIALFVSISFTIGCRAQRSLTLVKDHRSSYRIILPAEASKNEQHAAELLQNYIRATSGTTLPILHETGKPLPETVISIGRTEEAEKQHLTIGKTGEGFHILLQGQTLFMVGGQGHSIEYAVYHFAEKFLNGRKYDTAPVLFPQVTDIQLPGNLNEKSTPSFVYRQSYYPMSNDPEYLNWHGLQRFEDLWGLWGHSFLKLLPPSQYFNTHPEYYALVNTTRKSTQLCLSNPAVLRIVVEKLKDMMADNPDALYWSVAPNEGGTYCSCPTCRKVDEEEGGPQGSLIRFVNTVAAFFPDKKITTLAYGPTANAPLKTHAADNVVVFVSSIDAFREGPIREIPSAAAFRSSLTEWASKATQLFVWDYSVQFTNYLAPFPNLEILADNFSFFKKQNITGIFEQGSGDTYCDAAELNSYIQAKLLWDEHADVHTLTEDFCKGYYGPAAPYVLDYFQQRASALASSQKHLDIYGNPMIESRGFLSAKNMENYERLLQLAQQATPKASVYADHIKRLQLGLDYVALQQSRYYGVDERGFLKVENDAAFCQIRPQWKERVANFAAACKNAGVVELSENGLSPDAYEAEWTTILERRWPRNIALRAAVSLAYPFSEDFPAKGKATLTDGMTGFSDYSYNWLCFYGTDMGATVNMGKVQNCGTISMNFLDDPRHWIFLPESVRLEVSEDGQTYKTIMEKPLTEGTEHEDIRIIPVTFTLIPNSKVRSIRVTAFNTGLLPAWKNDAAKKSMIACDEIMVLP